MKKVEILDTTLRDGAQSANISFSVNDKLAVVQYLDKIGIDFIEGGNPASNPKDAEFFKKAAKLNLKNSNLVAFGSTHHSEKTPQTDANLKALIDAGTEYISIFGKSWDKHVTEILNIDAEKNLDMIYGTVKYLTDKGKKVFFDAEHFFAGFSENPDYALKTVMTAHNAGAKAIVLCDTMGAEFMEGIKKGVETVAKMLPDAVLGIHTHNDMGLAVANAITAVECGVTQVQGTFGGFGERCGNMDLCTFIPNVQLKLKIVCIPEDNMKLLTKTAHAVSEAANTGVDPKSPYVGERAFSHKGGMHTDAVVKSSDSYEHILPETVGNKRRFMMSEVSGRSAIMPIIHHVDASVERNSEKTRRILEKLKEMEHQGYQYEGAESSLEMLIAKELGKYKPSFELGKFSVNVSDPSADYSSVATIKISVGGKVEIAAAEGNGPVNALDRAIRRALCVFYPEIKNMTLSDFKVRVIESKGGTASLVRVVITSTDGERVWRTVGVSKDIIEASWKALVDSIEYYLGVVCHTEQ